jgi:hypothetical protein
MEFKQIPIKEYEQFEVSRCGIVRNRKTGKQMCLIKRILQDGTIRENYSLRNSLTKDKKLFITKDNLIKLVYENEPKPNDNEPALIKRIILEFNYHYPN